MNEKQISLSIRRNEKYCAYGCSFFDPFNKKCLLFKEVLEKNQNKDFNIEYLCCLSCDEVVRNINSF